MEIIEGIKKAEEIHYENGCIVADINNKKIAFKLENVIDDIESKIVDEEEPTSQDWFNDIADNDDAIDKFRNNLLKTLKIIDNNTHNFKIGDLGKKFKFISIDDIKQLSSLYFFIENTFIIGRKIKDILLNSTDISFDDNKKTFNFYHFDNGSQLNRPIIYSINLEKINDFFTEINERDENLIIEQSKEINNYHNTQDLILFCIKKLVEEESIDDSAVSNLVYFMDNKENIDKFLNIHNNLKSGNMSLFLSRIIKNHDLPIKDIFETINEIDFKKEEDFNEKKFISLFKHKEFNSKDLTDLEIPKIVLDFDISNALNTHEDLIIHLLKKDDYSEAVFKNNVLERYMLVKKHFNLENMSSLFVSDVNSDKYSSNLEDLVNRTISNPTLFNYIYDNLVNRDEDKIALLNKIFNIDSNKKVEAVNLGLKHICEDINYDITKLDDKNCTNKNNLNSLSNNIFRDFHNINIKLDKSIKIKINHMINDIIVNTIKGKDEKLFHLYLNPKKINFEEGSFNPSIIKDELNEMLKERINLNDIEGIKFLRHCFGNFENGNLANDNKNNGIVRKTRKF